MKDYMRFIARFLIQADTPLAIGIGSKNLLTDSPVAVDVNGLPVIPGTALCGVLRHSLAEYGFSSTSINSIFGFQEGEKGEGSRLIVSDALLVAGNSRVVEGIDEIDMNGSFLSHFSRLPVRQHCRITHRGVADTRNHGKFDEQVVYKGTRFVFELEFTANGTYNAIWQEMVSLISSPFYRIGSGTRKGFGSIKVIGVDETIFDLNNTADLQSYLDRSSSLATNIPVVGSVSSSISQPPAITTYTLHLTPDDFFLFGAGYGDNTVDMQPVTERVINWQGNLPEFSTEKTFIPATSVKGAISHRTAFHYNYLNEVFADKLPSDKTAEDVTGENNNAVASLFGTACDTNNGMRGKVLLSDLFLPSGVSKILNHVAIDRFTGGALDGALFSERVSATDIPCKPLIMTIMVENSAFAGDEKIRQAFERALTDITEGMLPLGGGVMRGHGVFSGTMKINEGEG